MYVYVHTCMYVHMCTSVCVYIHEDVCTFTTTREWVFFQMVGSFTMKHITTKTIATIATGQLPRVKQIFQCIIGHDMRTQKWPVKTHVNTPAKDDLVLYSITKVSGNARPKMLKPRTQRLYVVSQDMSHAVKKYFFKKK
jgi:hypothetical protein